MNTTTRATKALMVTNTQDRWVQQVRGVLPEEEEVESSGNATLALVRRGAGILDDDAGLIGWLGLLPDGDCF